MKQKTMDHELMTRINKEAQEKEQRKFEHAKAAAARLEAKRKVRQWQNFQRSVHSWGWSACRSKYIYRQYIITLEDI